MRTAHLTSVALRAGFSFHLSRLSETIFGSTEKFVEAFQTLGLPAYFVYVAGVIECFGGLAIGLFTPRSDLTTGDGSSDVEIQLQRGHLCGARIRTTFDPRLGLTRARHNGRRKVFSRLHYLPQDG